MDFIQNYAWIIWLALILVFVIIEVTTVTFMFLMLAIGALVSLILSLVGVPFLLQIVIAAVIAALLLFAVRPRLLRVLKRGADHARTGIDALSGIAGTILNDYNGNASTVKLANGETWTVEPADRSQPPLAAGDHVVVTHIKGATAFVAPAERTL